MLAFSFPACWLLVFYCEPSLTACSRVASAGLSRGTLGHLSEAPSHGRCSRNPSGSLTRGRLRKPSEAFTRESLRRPPKAFTRGSLRKPPEAFTRGSLRKPPEAFTRGTLLWGTPSESLQNQSIFQCFCSSMFAPKMTPKMEPKSQ